MQLKKLIGQEMSDIMISFRIGIFIDNLFSQSHQVMNLAKTNLGGVKYGWSPDRICCIYSWGHCYNKTFNIRNGGFG